MILAHNLFFLVAAANPLDPPEISNPVKIVALGVFGFMLLGITVLTFAKLWMDVLGKRHSATVSIQAHSDSDGKEKDNVPAKGATIDISGFVAAREFELHKEEVHRRAVGLEKQISESRHDWQRELQSILALATDRDESATEWRNEISGDMKTTGQKLAAVKQQADIIQATQTNMDAKIDRLIERHIPAPR